MKVSEQTLSELMDNVRGYVFPDYFPCDEERIKAITTCFSDSGTADAFMDSLPEIRRLLLTDVEAVGSNDPAADGAEEIILCYPAIKVMLHYRTAHRLLELGVHIVPRILTEMAHSATGIDIHPAAVIGEYFAIDHGTGIVVGKTAVIGKHVMLYQGVTLGAKNFRYDQDRHPLDVPRHPVLEDNVTVYSNASILGRVTIGHDTVVGGNVWLTHDVPPHSRITQSKFTSHIAFSDGEGI
ncbi:MAG: serine acetyltransferase [Bacteroidales bacterium]|nr:serine acetyltransferase [Bacteroidales bacterium]